MTDPKSAPKTKGRPRAKIDPRIAQRREAVAEANTRRRFRSFLVALGVVVFAFSVIGLLRSPLLDIDRVEVRGARATPVTAILAATGVSTQGHPMIAVDRFALARKIERLPWIATAEVDRRWPNTLRIRVTERVAIGAIGAPGGIALLDGTGRVLDVVEKQPKGTVAIIAPDKVAKPGRLASDGLRSALAVLRALRGPLAEDAESIRRLSGRPTTFELGLAGGVTIRFGEATRLGEKVTAAEAVYAVERTAGTVIDVRVPRAPAVTRSVTPGES